MSEEYREKMKKLYNGFNGLVSNNVNDSDAKKEQEKDEIINVGENSDSKKEQEKDEIINVDDDSDSKDEPDKNISINSGENSDSIRESEKDETLNDRTVELEKKIAELEKVVVTLNNSLKNKDDELNRVVEECTKKTQDAEKRILKREADVLLRENAINQREANEKDSINKFSLEEKAKLQAELVKEKADAIVTLNEQLEKKRGEFEQKLDGLEKKRFAELEKKIAQKKEEASRQVEKEISEKMQNASLIENKAKELNDKVVEKEKKLDLREKELDKREGTIKSDERKNDRTKRRLDSREGDLNEQEDNINALVQERMADKIAEYKRQLQDKDKSLGELRDKISELMRDSQDIETFKVSIGSEPVIIENKIQNLNKTIDNLKEELAQRASGDIQNERDRYKDDCDRKEVTIKSLEQKNRILEQKNSELSSFEVDNIKLTSKNQELESLVEELRGQNDNYRLRLERLSSSEARLSDRDQRIAEINKGYINKMFGAGLEMNLSEIEWLNSIYTRCDQYGIHFPQRILYAFHTALKISDWSSITVLAGVSGTGKSELPKLYAAFGGMNFINVPVQPNWDSQESMLGFFNSIDNRFEPEPLLRFLVQCTENEEYSKYMSVVLLDEMNLAHVEHYFADFLSKLETRRGSSKKNVPTVEVKLGAGVEPYQLQLKRSVLWTGTMNQDETTKSLSDKVLDRGLVINFPRPRELKSRVKMGILDTMVEESGRPMLTRQTWGQWIVREVDLVGDQESELNYYKKIVEEINDELESVGRALGHRVWQSIEYYILNYPTVVEEMNNLSTGEVSTRLKQEMKIAFEDQIVQKIMPKLRGVETRGRAKENLGKIEALLEEKGFEQLKDDFENACEQGYGQFIWSSAKYIEVDEAERLQQADNDSADNKDES